LKETFDVAVFGIGDLGSWVVEFLSRLPEMEHRKILIADINEEVIRKRAFSAWAGTSYLNKAPKICIEKINLFMEEETCRLLRKYNPRIICNVTSLQSWWVVDELPRDLWSKLETEAGLGPWIPMHLTLTHKLMRAVKESGIDTLVVNTSFPDLTNPVLGKIGLAPSCGIGNADLLIPGIKREVSKRLNVPSRDVFVYLVGHHSHVMQFMILGRSGSPYYLKIMVDDKDVTTMFDPDELIKSQLRDWLPGRYLHPIVASSAVKNIWNMLMDTGEISFAPGPNGEIGGYPIRISAKGVEVVLPDGLKMEQARQINIEAQKKDGVEEIKSDGTIIFTDKAHALMKETMNYDCKELKIDDNELRYQELLAKYKELKRLHGLS